MAWTKHFSVVKAPPTLPTEDRSASGYTSMTARTASWLNIAYQGNPQRIPRYYQFQEMDSDSDINTALDTIADFCTQSEEQTDEPFEIKYNGDPNESEVKIVKQMLDRWIRLNGLRARLWYMFRDTIKNGDAFFLRDPETHEWLWLDHFMVELVKVDETKGKIPDEYIVRGLDYNRQDKFATKQADPNAYRTPFGTATIGGARPMASSGSSAPASFSMAGAGLNQRQAGIQGPNAQELSVIDAEHVVHLSLSIGNDINWPFGSSILEPIFKTYKQKELLEDATIIYRVQRAPERRIFYIDVGTMPPERAKRHIESIKNDIHQRRIPNRTGGGGSILDAAYNPLSINDDYFFAQGTDGRGSKVETLPGGQCLSLNTAIPLLDGRTLTLLEIISEFNEGKQLWAYSCHPTTGHIVPGMINWAGVTRKQTKVLRLTLDNGETMTVTPDHRFPVQGRGKTEAKDICVGDSLIPFNTRTHEIKKGRTQDYHQVFDNQNKRWVFTHRMVAKYFREHGLVKDMVFNEDRNSEAKTTVHHINFDRFNNDPSNLSWVNYKDHYEYHSATLNQTYGHLSRAGYRKWYDNLTAVQKLEIAQKLSRDHQKYWDELSPGKREIALNKLAQAAEKGRNRRQYLMATDAVYRAQSVVPMKEGHKKAFLDDPSMRTRCASRLRDYWRSGKMDASVQDQTLKFDDHAMDLLVALIDCDTSTRVKLAAKANACPQFMSHIRDINRDTVAANFAIDRLSIKDHHLRVIFRRRGTSWKEVRDRVLSERSVKLRQARTLVTDVSLMQKICQHFQAGKTRLSEIVDTLNHDDDFIAEFGKLNADRHHLAVSDRIDHGTIYAILEDFGFTGWKHFKSANGQFNHQVVAIEYLDTPIDTGTLTIDGLECYHDYHTFALASGVFTYNSTGDIGDLTFFSKKLARGLRVPVSYLNIGEDESSNVSFNDGKLGAAMIQEYRFSKYCMRLQSLLAPVFDKEFKRYLKKNGIEIEAGLFDLQFAPPQSFTRYRQIELDSSRVSVYQGVAENKKLSERFKLKRFLGLSEDEIIENEEMWSQENADKLKRKTGASPAEANMGDGLSAVGLHPENDMGMGDLGEMPEAPTEGAAGPGANAAPAGAPPAGGAAPGAAPGAPA